MKIENNNCKSIGRIKLKISSKEISILALVISILAFVWTVFIDIGNKVENLQVFQLDSNDEDIVEITKGYADHVEGVYGFYTENPVLIISNNSSNDISIIDYWVESKNREILMTYFGKNDTLDIKLPINIKANSTVSLKIKVKYILSKEAYDVLEQKYGMESVLKYKEFDETLFNAGIDQFGNLRNLYKDGNDYKLREVENIYKPKIKLTLTTTKNGKFSGEISPR